MPTQPNEKVKKLRFSAILALISIALILVVAVLYGFFIEPDRLVVREYEIAIDGWDSEFDGLKIVAISDIHGGAPYISTQKIREIVRVTNSINPDLIVFLGDFVSQRKGSQPVDRRSLKMPVSEIADALKGLKARHGVFAVLGNNDLWFSSTIVASEIERVGIRVLENEVVSIEEKGNSLKLLGLLDHTTVRRWRTYSENAKQVLDNEGGGKNVIVLQHSPDIVPLVTGDLSISNDLKLFLAGHTHGGQVWFPLVGAPIVPSLYGQKYASGHIYDRDLDIFVTTGIGTSVLPVRFLVPPEISVLSIKRK